MINASVVEEKYHKRPIKVDIKEDSESGKNEVEISLESSSDSEEEDDEGIFVSEELDAQIEATLVAIREKDPRVYDEKATFYNDDNFELHDATATAKQKPQPMYLKDYHRKNLLKGITDGDSDEEKVPTYAQQQTDLRQSLVKELHAVEDGTVAGSVKGDSNKQDISDDEDFLVMKASQQKPEISSSKILQPSSKSYVASSDQDPETFLSNFIASRAWVPSPGTKFQPFESDDEDEERQAEAFEEAYNLRFEDPKVSNEKLLSHARDAAAKYSVRNETASSRKAARVAERAKRDEQKREREKEKARLRKLRVEDAEEKIRKIKEAAGLRGNEVDDKDWLAFLGEVWDDDGWEDEMKKRFGDNYYADHAFEKDRDIFESGKLRLRKPKWSDDINIKDLVPDFDQEQNPFSNSYLSLLDEEPNANPPENQRADSLNEKSADSAERPKSRIEQILKKEVRKNQVRSQRRKVEAMVDEKLRVDNTLSEFGHKHTGHFRYRETSPLTYGLTAQDILMATDSQLNQYTGLKKLASFRDAEKKKKDKKRLGKKARLRQWRKETFGDEEGPQKALGDVIAGDSSVVLKPSFNEYPIRDGAQGEISRKRRRNRDPKSARS